MIGFKDALLIPVSSWRPRMNAFVSIPSHCCVIVPLDDKWICIDVATVDCVDGVLDLSAKVNVDQLVNNGSRYKFQIYPDSPVEYPDELRNQLSEADSEFVEKKKSITVALMKEEPIRNDKLDLIEPITMGWIPRFSFQLPIKDQKETFNLNEVEFLKPIVTLPRSLPLKIAELLTEYTTLKDPKSHHYKQWVGIKYTTDRKYILAGYRIIEQERPFSQRRVKWCGGIDLSNNKTTEATTNNENKPVPEQAISEALKYLETTIGIQLNANQIENLLTSHNYHIPNIDHVWGY